MKKLQELYNKISKHSHYQRIPNVISKLINQDQLVIKSRSEEERLQYIKTNISLQGKRLADIGGNSGYFSFEAIDSGAKEIQYIEGNVDHYNLVKSVTEILGWDNKILPINEYFNFEKDFLKLDVDVCFLLNVLHHLGDDFGDVEDQGVIKGKIIDYVNSLSQSTSYLIFQLGFNWKGDIQFPLFQSGTKSEMIDFIKLGVKDHWTVEKIGVPVEQNKNIIYEDLSEKNIERNDKLGEFLNRPLFILKSLKKC